MRVVRIVLWALGIMVISGVVGAAVIYAMVCRVPSEYPRQPLGRDERERAAKMFFDDHVFARFHNKVGAGKPFVWTITAERLNQYLASMDQIASLSDKPIYPSVVMERLGFAGPAVAMRPGVLTFMVHSNRYNKVLSVDVEIDFNDAGEVTARTVAMRIGVMPVPKSMLDRLHQKVRRKLIERLSDAEKVRNARIGPVPVGSFAKLLRSIIGILDGQYVRPELTWQRHPVLVDRVEISEGELAVHFVPVPRRRPAAATARSRRGAG